MELRPPPERRPQCSGNGSFGAIGFPSHTGTPFSNVSRRFALPGTAAAGATAGIGLALGFADAGGLPFDFLNPKRPAEQRDMRKIKILAGVAAAVTFTFLHSDREVAVAG